MAPTILTEQSIINTYNKIRQKQCQLYKKYLRIKQQNPTHGYKRLSRLLDEPIHRTRLWHHNSSVPQPIITTTWLKERNILPLNVNNQKLPLIAKILGSTFGDGGVFQNLNAIFLSSSELEAVIEFDNDLEHIFGPEINKNSRIIEAGEYGHSWCYQNTNRKAIRFFQALGSPIGKKTNIGLNIPNWIFLNQKIQDEFFGSFFGSELGTPTIHKNKKQLTSLDIGLVTSKSLLENRIIFFRQIGHYLNNKNIKTGKISISKQEDSLLLRLSISKTLDNYLNFIKNIKLNYCYYKQERLINTANQFINNKNNKIKELRNRLNHLTKRPFSESWIKNNLRLSDKAYIYVQNNKTLEKWI